MTKTLPPASVVREWMDYDPGTGQMVWRKRAIRPGLERTDGGWNTRFAGKVVAGRRHRHGHLYVNIAWPRLCQKNYAAHRLAWAHFYGEWPVVGIDHINGNPSDNRIANLRLASQTQNMRNSRRRSNNTSGVKGVSWAKRQRKWYAYINVGGRMRSLGLFSALGDAVAARRAAALHHFGEFASEHHDLAGGGSF
jgi:hypothetical protein